MLVPVALEMIQEKFTEINLFSKLFGGVREAVVVRDGDLRARGPFRHAILAGTVGAALVPIMIGLWRRNPRAAKIGMIACLTMVASCASSGPVLSLGFGLMGVFLWKFRRWMGMIRWSIPLGYMVLAMIMTRPVYYIIGELSMGASLFSHVATSISVAYYDQSVFFFWFSIATISSFHWMRRSLPAAAGESAPPPGPASTGCRFPTRCMSPASWSAPPANCSACAAASGRLG